MLLELSGIFRINKSFLLTFGSFSVISAQVLFIFSEKEIYILKVNYVKMTNSLVAKTDLELRASDLGT